jgi:hypothetical protein
MSATVELSARARDDLAQLADRLGCGMTATTLRRFLDDPQRVYLVALAAHLRSMRVDRAPVVGGRDGRDDALMLTHRIVLELLRDA